MTRHLAATGLPALVLALAAPFAPERARALRLESDRMGCLLGAQLRHAA
jgi:hypothetical protein